MISGVAGMLVGGICCWVKTKVPQVEWLLKGSLAGLVASTACCKFVTTSQSFVIGGVASVILFLVVMALEKLRVDDPVDAIAVHGGSGAWSVLAVGLFGDQTLLGTGLSRSQQVLVQLHGVLACTLWGFGVTYSIMWIINRFFTLRVNSEAEQIGLNIAEHHAKNDLYEILSGLESQANEGNFSKRLTADPFTEVGQIAQRYNLVMDKLEATQNELLKSQKETQAASRSKSLFLANLSHEVRNPLNVILGYTQIMKLTETDKETIERPEIIEQSGNHLLKMLNDILDLSKAEEQKVELEIKALKLRPFVETLKNIAKIRADAKGIELRTHVDSSLPEIIEADELRLRQVLLNLINNAIKFTEKGHVMLEVTDECDALVAGNNTTTCKHVQFRVKDSGIGLNPEEVASIFKPFEQAGSLRKRTEGTGLGLPISSKLVQKMGGRIKVESVPVVGTCFSFGLPC